MKIVGLTAIVTGGAMGIGLATVKKLLDEGCTVTIWDISEEAMDSAKKELEEYNGKVFFHKCDVTDKNSVYGMVVIAKNEMGRVDILINNAGYVAGGNILDQSDDEWEKTININLTSMIYTIKAVLPGMYERNYGHIVNISSASSVLGVPALSVYTATKWGVWGLTESLRFEAINAGKKEVKFSSIHPSYIRSGMFKGAKLGFLGNLIVPQVKSHDVIAKAIVNGALKRGKYSVKRPRTLRLAILLRGILPDVVYQKLMIIMGVHKSMSGWEGRGEK